MTQKILIFRRGSIGDAVVSLPALLALRQRYPDAELRLLTNAPIMGRAAPISTLLGRSDLISDYFILPPGGGGLTSLREARSAIKSWGPDKLIYLSEPSSRISLMKEAAFFKACGIGTLAGLPFASALHHYKSREGGLWESESARLLRATGLTWPDKIELVFDKAEQNHAQSLVSNTFNDAPFIALCIGGKLPDKNWGDANWRSVLSVLSSDHPKLGLLLIGAEDESERSLSLSEDWLGPVLNLCGKTNPRESALAMKDAAFYLGHDSGPMHLAALMKVPCIALFSARAKPGVWFPFGDKNSIFYPWEMADKVNDKVGFRTAGVSILSIQPTDVIKSCLEHLNKSLKT